MTPFAFAVLMALLELGGLTIVLGGLTLALRRVPDVTVVACMMVLVSMLVVAATLSWAPRTRFVEPVRPAATYGEGP